MSNEKSGFNLSIGGDVSGDVAQTIDKSHNQTTNIAGDMHGDVNNSMTADAWADVQGAVSELPEDEQQPVAEAVEQLKTLTEADEPPVSEFNGIIETLKPYKGIANLALKAVKLTPAASIAGPLLDQAINATA